jgi:hypothetical protein
VSDRRSRFAGAVLATALGAAVLAGCHGGTHHAFAVDSMNTTPDAVPGNGVCADGAGFCTLRAALDEANALGPGDAVEVHLSGDTTYSGSNLPSVTGDVWIIGEGATISAGTLTVTSGRLRLDALTFDGVTIRLLGSTGTVVTRAVTIVRGGGVGAVEQSGGSLLMIGSEIGGSAGAGLLQQGGVAVLVSTVIDQNLFGGIDQTGGDLTLVGSTVAEQVFDTMAFVCNPFGCFWVPISVTEDGITQSAGASLTLVASTVAFNQVGIRSEGSVALHGSAVAENLGAACVGVVSSLGFTADDDGTCVDGSVTGDLPAASVLLTLVDGDDPPGGPSRLVMPAAGSDLVDAIPAGTADLCPGFIGTDGRGAPRPAGAGCDIGAIERQPSDP